MTAISAEPETIGEQMAVDVPTLLGWLSLYSRGQQSLQLWLDPDTDLYCRVRRVRGQNVAVEFSLDGVSESQAYAVAEEITSLFLEWSERSEALVVDRWGGTADLDWDMILLDGRGAVSVVPDLVGAMGEATVELAELARARGVPLRAVAPFSVFCSWEELANIVDRYVRTRA